MTAAGGTPPPHDAPRAAVRHPILFRLGAILLGSLAMVLILEGAFRIYLIRYAESSDRIRDHISRNLGGALTLFDIVRPSDAADRIYELIPGAQGRFTGQPLVINAHGFRDAERETAKPDGVLRVAVLGDSVAFGWAVAQEERFTERLEALLNDAALAAGLALRFEVLNFAVPGYNTAMELATLESAVLDYSPDVVVLSVVGNDHELPNFVRIEPEVWSLRTSFIYEAIRDVAVGRKVGDTARGAAGGIAQTGGVGPGRRVRGTDPERIPPEYRHLLGWEMVERSMQRFAEVCAEHEIPVIAFLFTPFPLGCRGPTGQSIPAEDMDVWAHFAQAAGLTVVDPRPALTNLVREAGGRCAVLWAAPDDIHPNPRVHSLLAAELFPVAAPLLGLPEAGPSPNSIP